MKKQTSSATTDLNTGTEPSGPLVVIVGSDGTEHEFPAGFDPKRAASIVRKQEAAAAIAPQRPKGNYRLADAKPVAQTGEYRLEDARPIGADGHTLMPQTLAQMARAKFPGAYDDLSDQQLEAKIKAKFPGAYDDLPVTPEQKPQGQRVGSYLPHPHDPDFARRVGAAMLGPMFSRDTRLSEAVGNGVIGALKGAGHTAETIGNWFRKIPGVGDALTAAGNAVGAAASAALGNETTAAPVSADQAHRYGEEITTPTNTAQKIGHGAEQVGEFFVPAGAGEKTAATIAEKAAPVLAKAAERLAAAAPAAFRNAPRVVPAVAKAGAKALTEGAMAAGVTAAQGGDPVSAGTVGAALPVAATAARAMAPVLKGAAVKSVEQALGARKERYKAMAQRLAPEILKRGIRGSQEQIVARAAQAAEDAGQQIDDAIQQFGDRRVSVQPLVDALETAKDGFRARIQKPLGEAVGENLKRKALGRPELAILGTPNAQGLVEVAVETEPRAIRQLTTLQGVIQDLGPDARVDQLIAVRRTWDKVVDQAGGFAHRAPGAIGMPLKDASEAAAKREATTAIRKLLDAEVPELTALNKEFHFWRSLEDVATQTLQRKGPQGPGLGKQVAEVAGAAAGSGHGIGAAFALGKVARMAQAVFNSPRWQLASAQMKDRLAEAIANNDAGRVAAALARISGGATSLATR